MLITHKANFMTSMGIITMINCALYLTRVHSYISLKNLKFCLLFSVLSFYILYFVICYKKNGVIIQGVK